MHRSTRPPVRGDLPQTLDELDGQIQQLLREAQTTCEPLERRERLHAAQALLRLRDRVAQKKQPAQP